MIARARSRVKVAVKKFSFLCILGGSDFSMLKGGGIACLFFVAVTEFLVVSGIVVQLDNSNFDQVMAVAAVAVSLVFGQ